MNFVGPLMRVAALAGLLLVTPMAAAPAYAAKADVDLLKSYIGTWKGRGQLIGSEKEAVVCRLTLSQGNQDKVNYSGRCTLAGTTLAVNGSIAYNEAGKRYEAAMTSNVTFSGVAIGKKQGNGIVFNLREKEKDEKGNDLAITASITLQPESIGVSFDVVFTATGDTLAARVPFSR
jgi:hypothetical protein